MKYGGVVGLLALVAACGAGDETSSDATPASQNASAWFVDVTSTCGVDFVHDAGLAPEKHLPETMGAGGAVFDADEDGDLDLYLLQGGPMRLPGATPGTFVEPTGPLPSARLFANDGRGHFSDVSERSGDAAQTGYGMGVAVGDVDRDGHLDLFVTNLGRDKLFLGDGRGSYRDATAASGLRDERWTAGACLFDADGDDDLDLYVAGYLVVDLADPEWCGTREPGWRSACHPDRYPAEPDRFWRNRGDGTFEDATASAGLAESFGKGLGVIACDVERDGDLDLFIANDSTENILWLNDGSGSFSDGTLLSGLGVDARGLTEACMGQASGDVDGDLDFELLVTNYDDESDTLYFNDGAGLFEDRTLQAGLEAPSRLPVGFGCVLEDFDLDGDLDLAVANGHIIDNIALYDDGKTHAQRALLYENDGRGRFRELGSRAGDFTATALVGRGLYSGDLDGDGDADLVLTQCGGATRLFRNDRGRAALCIRGLPRNTTLELVAASGKRMLHEIGPQPSYFGQCGPDVLTSLGEPLVEILTRVPYSPPWSWKPPAPIERGRIEFVREGTQWRANVVPWK